MSAVPESGTRLRDEPRGSSPEEPSQSVFWQWFALAILLFAWIAEATMCAERGF